MQLCIGSILFYKKEDFPSPSRKKVEKAEPEKASISRTEMFFGWQTPLESEIM